GLAVDGGVGGLAVPVHRRQRDADLRRRVTDPVDDDGSQLQGRALDGVSGGDLLRRSASRWRR
ncbi:hypothetical protein, partial [Mycolicibacterium elephantis]|uniref:hypothetical protein n=1 Tax=Mycolicibacterium elephantis TaxID=81858 RepID=UPI001969EFEF